MSFSHGWTGQKERIDYDDNGAWRMRKPRCVWSGGRFSKWQPCWAFAGDSTQPYLPSVQAVWSGYRVEEYDRVEQGWILDRFDDLYRQSYYDLFDCAVNGTNGFFGTIWLRKPWNWLHTGLPSLPDHVLHTVWTRWTFLHSLDMTPDRLHHLEQDVWTWFRIGYYEFLWTIGAMDTMLSLLLNAPPSTLARVFGQLLMVDEALALRRATLYWIGQGKIGWFGLATLVPTSSPSPFDPIPLMLQQGWHALPEYPHAWTIAVPTIQDAIRMLQTTVPFRKTIIKRILPSMNTRGTWRTALVEAP